MIKYILILVIFLVILLRNTKEMFSSEIENLVKHNFVQKKIDKYLKEFMDSDKCITKDKFPKFIRNIINNLPLDTPIKNSFLKHYNDDKINSLYLNLISLKRVKNVSFSNKICKTDLENLVVLKLK